MTNSGNKKAASQTKNIFMTKPKSPKVKTFKGKAIRFKTGFKTKLNKPKTEPTKIIICQLAVRLMSKNELWPGIIPKETPGTNFTAKKIPTIPAMI